MSNQSYGENWTVVFESEVLPFVSFQSALSYADGLIAGRSLVKEINIDHRVIRLLDRVAFTPLAMAPEQDALHESGAL